jgi:hypothetical protein
MKSPVISGSGSSINIVLKYTGTDILVHGNIEVKNSSWTGVQIGGTGNAWTNVFTDVTFSNNIANGCGGIHYWRDDNTNFPATNLKIINNTVANNPSGTGIYIESIMGQSLVILNNLADYSFTSEAGITQSNNIMAGVDIFIGGSVSDPNSVKLKSDIPGVDTGVRDDFGGNARTLPLSVGAWEFGG